MHNLNKQNHQNVTKVSFLWIFYDKKMTLFSPGFEPGTFCVLDRCDNHYTTKTDTENDTNNVYEYNVMLLNRYPVCSVS